MLSEGGVRIQLEKLDELEDMVRQLTLAALKLPPGLDRRESLIKIGGFRERIVSMKSELECATVIQMQQFKRTGRLGSPQTLLWTGW